MFGPPSPQRVRPQQHRRWTPVPSDRDLLTTLDAIEHLGQDRPGRTHPAVSRTPLYADVQNIGAKSQPDSVTTTCKPMTDVMPEQQVGDLVEVVGGEPASSDDRDASTSS
jgi:hypothetical protein